MSDRYLNICRKKGSSRRGEGKRREEKTAAGPNGNPTTLPKSVFLKEKNTTGQETRLELGVYSLLLKLLLGNRSEKKMESSKTSLLNLNCYQLAILNLEAKFYSKVLRKGKVAPLWSQGKTISGKHK